jgi:hypothetical protein
MNKQELHIADLVAFVAPAELPGSLRPFVKTDRVLTGEARWVVFKIRGTVDSYYGLVLEKETGIDDVEKRIENDLGIVQMSGETKQQLDSLIEQWQHDDSVHFLSHRLDVERYPFRH